MPLYQPVPELVVAHWPAASSTPLLQGFAAGECARLVLEYVQVVFEVEDVLVTTVGALVTRDAAALVPDLDRRRGEFDLRLRGWQERRRIGVGPHFDTAQPIHRPEADLHQIEALTGQRQQMLALDRRRLTHRLLASVDAARLVFATPGQQHRVQGLQVARRRHRDEVISPKVADFSFDAPLFMPLARRTEARFEIPVGTERHEARRLLAAKTTQDLLHR